MDIVASIDDIGIRNPARDALKYFFDQLRDIQKYASENCVRKVIDYVLDKVAYDEYLAENFSPPEHEARNDNIGELKNLASRYDDLDPEVSLMHFLEDIALITDQDNEDGNKDRVILMTAHAAK